MKSKLYIALCVAGLLTASLWYGARGGVVRSFASGAESSASEPGAREAGREAVGEAVGEVRGEAAEVEGNRTVEQRELVEVWVDGRPLENLFARGRWYVEAMRGAEYELRIRNPYAVRVAVALSVDGLNTIDARRTTRWDSSKWVIEPYQSITIRGWQMSSERARRFYFTHERDSYAARLGRPSDLGTISAVFYRERTPAPPYITRRQRPYPSEAPEAREEAGQAGALGQTDSMSKERAANAPLSRSAPNASASRRRGTVVAPEREDEYAATGIGRSETHEVTRIHLDLDPRPASEVSIRYEYRDALVRLGVLPRHTPPSPVPLQRRERARGFSDQPFCPEP